MFHHGCWYYYTDQLIHTHILQETTTYWQLYVAQLVLYAGFCPDRTVSHSASLRIIHVLLASAFQCPYGLNIGTLNKSWLNLTIRVSTVDTPKYDTKTTASVPTMAIGMVLCGSRASSPQVPIPSKPT